MSKAGTALKYGGIAAGSFTAIGLMVNAILVWVSGARLEKQLDAIRSAGDPIVLADLAQKPIPPEENAAAVLRRAKSDLDALDKELQEFYVDPLELDEKKIARIRATFEAYPQVLSRIKQAADAPHYQPQVDTSLTGSQFIAAMMDEAGPKRAVARLLELRTRQQLADNHPDEALETCLTLLRLTRKFDQDFTMINHLVSIACRGVAIAATNRVVREANVSEASREKLDAELAEHDTAEDYVHALKTERVLGLSMYSTEIPWGRWWFTRAYHNTEVLKYLEYLQQAIDGASKPFNERKAPQPDESHGVASMILPAVQAHSEAHTRVRAQLRCLRVLNALQKDGMADDQDIDLKTLDIPAEATIDPFTGKPLLVKQTPEGPVIYSVFKDLEDDGGKVETFEDVGVGPVPDADRLAEK